MERCLYCGEPIALLQRWKLGKTVGRFCSEEHQDAYDKLQRQAVHRLMKPGFEEQAAIVTADDPGVPDPPLAPAAMDLRAQDAVRQAAPSIDRISVEPSPSPPRMMPTTLALAPAAPFAIFPRAVAITTRRMQRIVPLDFIADWADLVLPVFPLSPSSPELEIPSCLPFGQTLHNAAVPPLPAMEENREVDKPLLLPKNELTPPDLRIIGALSMDASAADQEISAVISSFPSDLPPCDPPVSLPHRIPVPSPTLKIATVSAHKPVIRTTRAAAPLALPSHASLRSSSKPLLPYSSLGPLYGSTMDDLPAFFVDELVGSPLAPEAGASALALPALLLVLKRERPSELPPFRAIPIPSLQAASNPIISFEAIPW